MNRNALLRTKSLQTACLATSALAFASAVASAGTYKTITIDGTFTDWDNVPVLASDPAGDGSPIDYGTVQIANDANDLYLRITYQTPVNPNAAGSGNSNLAFDTDSNTATGFDIYGLGLVGSEVGFQNDFPFSQGTGVFNTGRGLSAGAAIAPFDYGNQFNAFTSQEYSIPRNLAYADNGQLVFGSAFKMIFWSEGGTAADVTAAIPYSFAALTTGWSLGGSGDYNVASNWSTNSVPNSVDAIAEFGTSITKAETVYSNTAVTAGTLIFNNANTYVLAGAGSLTLDVSTGTAAINVLAGSQKVNLPLRLNKSTVATVATGSTLTIADPLTLVNGATLTKSGAGTMEIISTVSNVAGGASTFATAQGVTNLRTIVGTGVTLLSSGGTTRSFTTQRVSGVNITGGTIALDSVGPTKVLVTDSLAISGGATPTGTLDIGDNAAIVKYTGTSPAETIRALIKSGRVANGTGIKSSAAGTNTAIGYANSGQIGVSGSFLGESFTGSAALIRYTVLGDANLSGTVNFDDLIPLAQNYNGTNKEWYQGDFNYDGVVNFDDLIPLAQNYNKSLPASLASEFGSSFASDWALAQSLVPEPTSLAAVGLGAVALTRRVKRARG